MKRVCDVAGIEYKALHACRRAYVSVAIDEEVVEQLNHMYDFMNLGFVPIVPVLEG